jgi:hypothetical protein
MTQTKDAQKAFREFTNEFERKFGYDSVQTIEKKYKRIMLDPWNPKFECCYPDCEYTVVSPVAMWRHVHGIASDSPHPPPDLTKGE